jgi:hypothetical protein
LRPAVPGASTTAAFRAAQTRRLLALLQCCQGNIELAAPIITNDQSIRKQAKNAGGRARSRAS